MKSSSFLVAIAFGLLLAVVNKTLAVDVRDYRGAAEPSTRAEVYGQGVRETAWQSPADERLGFHLPPGFEIELFASEPEITKPLNMAWDTRGRLWVTCTVEYPYPVADGTPRDTIRILEDTDGDGRADKFITFADQLNIPMGVLPVAGGAICFDIPNLVFLKDSDGDDHVDERIQLLGPFDTTRDTHGMVNSLTQAADGWIYACHGFNNQSKVTAADGSQVTLHSGNTFRFRADGSRIEHFTRGQVNPFGLTRDEWGNFYSADCHSKPITALLPGGCYPSFGRPHDGLGFAPDMMQHLHGSTAICGLVYYQAEHFPAAYRHLMFSGNVMTSRINCNALQWQGSTPTAVEQADFLTSDDPWFRPVDIQLAHDGSLAVADFYNKIIGHYEVPLTHPERDRDSGRIWRIVYTGDLPKVTVDPAPKNQTQQGLSNSNLTVRRSAIEQALRAGSLAQAELESQALDSTSESLLRQSALEILHRQQQLRPAVLLELVKGPDAPLQVLALILANEQPVASRQALLPEVRSVLVQRLFANSASERSEAAAQICKAAVRFIGNSGDASDVESLLTIAGDDSDPMLAQAARIATRELLREPRNLEAVTSKWGNASTSATNSSLSPAVDDALAEQLARVLHGLDSADAARALLAYCAKRSGVQSQHLLVAIEKGTKFVNEGLALPMLTAIDIAAADDAGQKALLLMNLIDGMRAKGNALPVEVVDASRRTLDELFDALTRQLATSGPTTDWADDQGGSWQTEERQVADGTTERLTSSLTRSEKYTGVLHSESFACPNVLSFCLAGHNGTPDKPDHRKNYVRLVQVATGRVLAEAFPPRNDTAMLVDWNLQAHAGQIVRMDVVDADDSDAYAWIAIGRFSLQQLRPDGGSVLRDNMAGLLQRGIEGDLSTGLASLADLSPRQRARLVAATLEGRSQQPIATLVEAAIAIGRSDLVTIELLGTSNAQTEEYELSIALELCASANAAEQKQLVDRLLSNSAGCKLLAQLLDRGSLSLQTLQGSQPLFPINIDAAVRSSLMKSIEAASLLPPQNVNVEARVAGLKWENANLDSGRQVFKQQCGICHKFGEEGQLVGPQLDGVKLRGAERLSEDILDPNRNVDRAFRTSALLLEDDKVISGLVREEPDGSLTVVGQDGKTQRVAAKQVVERRDSQQSLMPSNFGEVLNDDQLASLLKYVAEGP